MQSAAPSAADVERVLAEVYARPELAPPDPSRVSRWLGSLWSAIDEWLRRLFGGIDLTPGGAQFIGWLVAALFVLVAAVVLLHLLRSGASWWETRDRAAPAGEGLPLPAARGASDWQAHARRLAEAGRWREAVLALYQALVLGLDARGAVRYDAAKTPGDYRRELRADTAMSRLFDVFLRTFEPAAFGSRAADAAVFGRLEALAAEARRDG